MASTKIEGWDEEDPRVKAYYARINAQQNKVIEELRVLHERWLRIVEVK